jgi:hypothetical protein
MDLTLSKVWELLDRICRNRESWYFDLGSKGEIKIEFECLRAFEQTSEVKAIAEEHYLDPDIVLHVLQSFSKHLKAPKKNWFRCKPPQPKKVCIIYAPLEPLAERPPIVDKVPFPNTVRKNMLMKRYMDQQEAEK